MREKIYNPSVGWLCYYSTPDSNIRAERLPIQGVVCHAGVKMAELDVIFSRTGKVATMCMNRPKALNALRLQGIRLIGAELDKVQSENICLISKGSGKAFCAGGDIKTIWEQGKANDRTSQLTFFREEYIVDYRLAKLRIPQVALWDGAVMGGGVGVSIHAKYRIATEKAVFAMPETQIGFVPDVGGSWFLNHLPEVVGGKAMGMYLALTGARLTGSALVQAGVATHFVPSAELPALEASLQSCATSDEVHSVITKAARPAEQPFTAMDVKDIVELFSHEDVPSIVAACAARASSSRIAAAATAAFPKMSPTACVATMEQLKAGRAMKQLAQAYQLEYRLVQYLLQQGDFSEGVRALLVDKDNKPAWKPMRLEDVDVQAVKAALGPRQGVEEVVLQ